MPIENTLAKLTTQSPDTKPGSGGIPYLTSADVAAALGYVDGHVPEHRLGIHIVLARYCDDRHSMDILLRKNNLPREAYMIWWDLGLDSNINIPRVRKICEVALHDYCNPAIVRKHGDVWLQRKIGVGWDTWSGGLRRYYSAIKNRMYWLEDPVINIVQKAVS